MECDSNHLNQNFTELKYSNLGKKSLFVDDKFIASNESISRLIKPTSNIFWKRPSEIVKTPEFLSHQFNATDIVTKYDDYWFVCSITAVAGVPGYLDRIVPKNQSFESGNYAGIFNFCFWWKGHWTSVVIDDFLPVDEQNNLLYCRNNRNKNDFFISLLEKAYAKLNGSYEVMYTDGDPINAIIDMTGAIYESLSVQNMNVKDLWNMLYKSLQLNSTAITFVEKSGLVCNKNSNLSNGLTTSQAYVIIEAIEIFHDERPESVRVSYNEKTKESSIKLLKLRDPSGSTFCFNKEWNSTITEINKMSDYIKEEVNYNKQSKDFIFMSLDDYQKKFQLMNLITDKLDTWIENVDEKFGKTKWLSKDFYGSWIKGISSGGSENTKKRGPYWTNPQYFFPVDINPAFPEKVPIIIFFMQTGQKQTKPDIRKNEEMGFKIYRVKPNEPEQLIFHPDQLEETESSGIYTESRQICKKFYLRPGKYVIITSLKKKDIQQDFLLKISFPENLKAETENLLQELDALIGLLGF